MLNSLVERGMFDSDAETIINELKPQLEESDQSMSQRWDDDINEYAVPIKAMWSLWLNKTALDWIDKNCPQHWARPLFLPQSQRDALFKENNIEV